MAQILFSKDLTLRDDLPWALNPTPYLEGHGDLVSRSITGVTGVVIWLIGVSNLRAKSP